MSDPNEVTDILRRIEAYVAAIDARLARHDEARDGAAGRQDVRPMMEQSETDD